MKNTVVSSPEKSSLQRNHSSSFIILLTQPYFKIETPMAAPVSSSVHSTLQFRCIIQTTKQSWTISSQKERRWILIFVQQAGTKHVHRICFSLFHFQRTRNPSGIPGQILAPCSAARSLDIRGVFLVEDARLGRSAS